MTQNPNSTPLLAVLIDADNVPAHYGAALLKEVTKYGEPALRRVYGDWAAPRLKPWADQVHELGMVAHQETANTSGKNASDIGLVIDAMDLLHSGRFDGFVLVSSDSDFTALAARIREQGLDVIGIGEAKTPVSLRNVCRRFIMLENLLPKPAEPPKESGKGSLREARIMLITAMEKIEQEAEWYSLSQVGSKVQADNPDFDTRTYGFSKLSDLVRRLREIDVKQDGKHILVRPATS